MERSGSTWASSSLCAVKFFGREKETENIISQITTKRNVRNPLVVIPISGSAGLGKTTLAQVVFHDEKVRNHFDIRSWVHLPDTSFDLMFILRIIEQSIDKGMSSEIYNLEQLPNLVAVGRTIYRKRFLLVLDNFSNDHLERGDHIISFLKRYSQDCVLIVTTRSKKFADRIATTKPLELSPLSSTDSRSLFNEIVLEPGEDSLPSDLETIGQEIVNRCSGVPSAIKGLALMLRFKREQSQWQQTLNGIKTIMELLTLDHEFYEDLPPYLKRCIDYCALFPETYSFNKEHLTDLWLAEGFKQPSDGSNLTDLWLAEGFKQPSDGSHLTDLWLAEGFKQPSDGRTLQQSYSIDDTARLLENCFSNAQEPQCKIKSPWHNFVMRKNKEHFSWIKDRQTSIPARCQSLSIVAGSTTLAFPSDLFRAKTLKTLILLREAELIASEQKCKIGEIPSILCQTLSDLRVLDLQFSHISQLPDTISRLSNLRYLNLSQTEIAVVPDSVGKLLSLQMLILSHCEKLTKIDEAIGKLTMLEKLDLEGCYFLADLPKSMRNMEKLRYLNIFGCSKLYQMPANMGNLTNLQTLSTYIASTGDGCTISELQNLNNLRGELCLTHLEKATSEQAIHAQLQSKVKIESLTLLWSSKADSDSEVNKVADSEAHNVIEGLKPNHNLKQLEIISYPGELYPGWICNLNHLIEIKLVNLKNVMELPPLGQLGSLQIVEMSGLDSITHVDRHFFGKNRKKFPSLKKLTFCYMPKIENWQELDETCGFECLEELCFIHCCKLTEVHVVLPTVKRLTMWMDNSLLYGQIGSLTGLSENLERVSIALCTKLSKTEQLKGLHDLKGLRELEISGCEELTTVPDGVQFLTTLQSLIIRSCSNFVSIPDWLGNFPENFIKVHDCPMFHSVPPEPRTPRNSEAEVPRTPLVQPDLSDGGVSDHEVQVHSQDDEPGVTGNYTVNSVPGVVISEPVIKENQKIPVVDGKGKEKVNKEQEQYSKSDKDEMTRNPEFKAYMERAIFESRYRLTFNTHNNDGASSSGSRYYAHEADWYDLNYSDDDNEDGQQ